MKFHERKGWAEGASAGCSNMIEECEGLVATFVKSEEQRVWTSFCMHSRKSKFRKWDSVCPLTCFSLYILSFSLLTSTITSLKKLPNLCLAQTSHLSFCISYCFLDMAVWVTPPLPLVKWVHILWQICLYCCPQAISVVLKRCPPHPQALIPLLCSQNAVGFLPAQLLSFICSSES